jgi:thiol-disulfide isomerase/thioredoxin
MSQHQETAAKTSLLTVSEATFGRHVLASPLPALVLFAAPACPASRALRPLLHELATAYAGDLRIAVLNAERASLIAEQFGVAASPTMLIVQHGEVVTRVVGFVPGGLLRLLCEQIAAGALPPDPFWSPTEATFEDLVVIPLLTAWGFSYVRQAPCPTPARGRIDLLVYDHAGEQPLTLFENKRRIMSASALQQAIAQAHTYARALRLPSFVIAAPAGIWVYACDGSRALAIKRLTSLELQDHPDVVPQLLRRLHG